MYGRLAAGTLAHPVVPSRQHLSDDVAACGQSAARHRSPAQPWLGALQNGQRVSLFKVRALIGRGVGALSERSNARVVSAARTVGACDEVEAALSWLLWRPAPALCQPRDTGFIAVCDGEAAAALSPTRPDGTTPRPSRLDVGLQCNGLFITNGMSDPLANLPHRYVNRQSHNWLSVCTSERCNGGTCTQRRGA